MMTYRDKQLSVKEILDRNINKFNSATDNVFQEVEKFSNIIHKNTLKGPGNFLVFNTSWSYELMKNYEGPVENKKSIINDLRNILSLIFIDARYKAYIKDKYFVFTSDNIPVNQVLVFRASDGIKFDINYDNDESIPNVHVSPSLNWAVGDVENEGFRVIEFPNVERMVCDE